MSNFEDSVNHGTDIDERLTRIEKTLKDITNILKTASEIVPSSTECRVMLLCAGILGRYYTDWHDVDENERTNVSQGGMWTRGNQAGIALRYITDTSSHTSDTVASLKNK